MHATLIARFPRLALLEQRCRGTSADNYFAIYENPTLPPGAEKQFVAWEQLLEALDDSSFETFLRKSAGRVAARSADRGWSQLVESMNEVRGYAYVEQLGFPSCRLLDEQALPLPDIEGSSSAGKICLVEVKTVQESDAEIQMRGQAQSGELGLPLRLQRVIRRAYRDAVKQISGHPRAAEAEKVCYMVINVDLPTALVSQNKRLLNEFIAELEDGDVRIEHTSQFWAPER